MIEYWRDRFHAGMFGSLAIAMALPGQRDAFSTAALFADAGIALLLLAQFRLWDDIADRGRDAIEHPDRVIVRAQRVRPFVIAATVIGAAAALAVARRPGAWAALTLLAVLNGTFAAFYTARNQPARSISRDRDPVSDQRSARTIAGELLRLSKYPAFVAIVSPAADPSVLIASGAAFLAAVVYEGAHDPTSPIRDLLPMEARRA